MSRRSTGEFARPMEELNSNPHTSCAGAVAQTFTPPCRAAELSMGHEEERPAGPGGEDAGAGVALVVHRWKSPVVVRVLGQLICSKNRFAQQSLHRTTSSPDATTWTVRLVSATLAATRTIAYVTIYFAKTNRKRGVQVSHRKLPRLSDLPWSSQSINWGLQFRFKLRRW